MDKNIRKLARIFIIRIKAIPVIKGFNNQEVK